MIEQVNEMSIPIVYSCSSSPCDYYYHTHNNTVAAVDGAVTHILNCSRDQQAITDPNTLRHVSKNMIPTLVLLVR